MKYWNFRDTSFRSCLFRNNEHKANIRNLSNDSKLVQHILKEKHKFDFSNVQTLALESDWRRRVIKESILTNRMLGNSVNDVKHTIHVVG